MIVLVPEPREPVPGGPPSGSSRSLRRTVTRAVTGLGSFTEDTLLGLVAAVAGVEYLAVRDLTVPPEIVRRLPGDVIRRHRALPVAFIAGELRGTLAVAMADPFDAATVDTLAAEARMSVKPILAAERALEAAIARHLAG